MLNKHALTKFNCFAAFNIYSKRITFGGFRGRRTDSVGGNCAGCNTHKAHKSKWSWSDQELEKSWSTKMWSTGAVEAWTERIALFFTDYEHLMIQMYILRFSGHQNGPKTPRNVS